MTYLDELKNIRLANHFHVGHERLCHSRSDAIFFFPLFLVVDLNMVFLSEQCRHHHHHHHRHTTDGVVDDALPDTGANKQCVNVACALNHVQYVNSNNKNHHVVNTLCMEQQKNNTTNEIENG